MADFLKKILLFVVTLIFLFLVLEGAFRLVRKDDALKLSMGRVDAKYHHTFEPHSTLHLVSSVPGEYDVIAHINNYGFRGSDMTLQKQVGMKRIFVVGDSFTFGVGANDEETIPALLQKKLDPGKKEFEFINVGRGNTSPLIYYLRLREEIPKFRPDAVVMLLDFSDLWEDWRFEQNLVYDAQGKPDHLNPYYEYGKFNLWNYLRANSVFCSYVHNKVVRTFLAIKKLGFRKYFQSVVLEGKRSKAVVATVSKDDTMEFDGKIFLRGRERESEIKNNFPRTAKYILMTKKLCESYGVRFLLAMYPYGIQVGPEQWGKGRVYWGFEEGRTYTDTFSFDLVQDFAKENHVPFINLLGTLRAHAGQKLYFDYDGHFTPAANQVVAEALGSSPVFLESIGEASHKLKG